MNVTIDESYGAWDLPSPLVIDGTQGASATIEVLDATAGFGQPWNINNWPFVYVVQLCETSAAVCAQLLGRVKQRALTSAPASLFRLAAAWCDPLVARENEGDAASCL